jgi:hypothetical protein
MHESIRFEGRADFWRGPIGFFEPQFFLAGPSVILKGAHANDQTYEHFGSSLPANPAWSRRASGKEGEHHTV